MIKNWLHDFGALRLLMIGFVLLLSVAAPFSGDSDYTGINILVSLIAPGLAVIMAFVVPLDMLMSFIFRTSALGDERLRMNRILKIEAITFVIIGLSWLPFFLRLLSA